MTRQQSLCGTGAGCEIDSAIDIDFAEAHNFTGVMDGLITKEHMVTDDTVKEVAKAIEDYDHEVRHMRILPCMSGQTSVAM